MMKSKFMTFSLVALAAASVTTGFTQTRKANIVGRQLTDNVTEPEYFQIPNDHHHADMQRAVRQARRTVNQFIKALQHPGPGQQDFEVKKPFTEGDQREHIWLTDVKLVGKQFQGVVDNKPKKIKGVKLGQVVTVDPKGISDWLYIENGKLVGGYTVRVHYNELSPEKKQEFDRQADFKIEKP